MFRPGRGFAFPLVLLCAFFPSALHASCPVPDARPNGEFFKADLVFSGTVLSQKYVEKELPARGRMHGDSEWFYRVNVSEVFKGPAAKVLTVLTFDRDTRYPLDTGRDYLLFAYRYGDLLVIDSCGSNAPLQKSGKAIASIKGISQAKDGEIEGWVAPITSGIKLGDINVVVRGGSAVYRVVTDKEGYFRFRAPPGHYRMEFTNGEYFANGGDTFWYNPDGFLLHAGETASLQVVAARGTTIEKPPGKKPPGS